MHQSHQVMSGFPRPTASLNNIKYLSGSAKLMESDQNSPVEREYIDEGMLDAYIIHLESNFERVQVWRLDVNGNSQILRIIPLCRSEVPLMMSRTSCVRFFINLTMKN